MSDFVSFCTQIISVINRFNLKKLNLTFDLVRFQDVRVRHVPGIGSWAVSGNYTWSLRLDECGNVLGT